MDKYTKKIIKYINKFIINYDENKIINKFNKNNNFIITLQNIIKNINFVIQKYDIIKINKLHNNNEPQLYLLYTKCFVNEIKNLSDFIKYYTLNQYEPSDLKIYLTTDELKQLYENIYEKNDERSEIRQLFYFNNFVSIDVIQELEINDIYHILINNDLFTLSLYYYDIDNINDYITNIINIIHIIHNINITYKISNVNKYNLIIFLGKQKKYLFADRITQMNMNSGSSIKEIFVVLWRKEEYEKVLIHELCHYIGIDHRIFTDYNIADINNYFNLDGINHINESYNETVASIINMCWKSYKLNMDLEDIYIYEMKFLILQTIKIIKFFNGTKYDDLFNINIIQNTSGLSYIILKMILFYNINSFMDLIIDLNIKCDTQEKINKFKKYLSEKIENKLYLQLIDDNFNKYTPDKKFINKTFRMSVI